MATAHPSDIVVTMHFDPMAGIVDLDRHMAETKAAAVARGFAFDRHRARNDLHAATFRLMDRHTIRLAASAGGSIAIEARRAS